MRLYRALKRLFSIEYILPEKKRYGSIPSTQSAYSEYIRIAWPAALQGLLMDLMLAIDLAMVGSLGANDLAAVGIMSQPKMAMLVAVRALSVPVTAMVARRKGEENIDEMNGILKQGIMLTAAFYIPFLALCYAFLPEIVSFAGAEGELIKQGAGYGRFIVIGLLFGAFSQIVGAALIGIGSTKIVFKANAIGNVANTVLNVFLIYGILFFPRLEVKGAGIATMIGNIITAIILLKAILNKKSSLNIVSDSPWHFRKHTMIGFAKIGGSALGEQSFERMGMFAYTKIVASLGVVVLATHHVCMNLCDIFYSFSMGLSYASASRTGQSLGENRRDMAEAYGKIGIRIGIILAALSCLIYILFRYPLIKVYTNDERVIELGAQIIVIMAIASFPQLMQLGFSGVLKGAGDSFYVMMYSLFVIAILRPILTYILCFTMNMGLYGAWIALLIDQALRMTFSGIRFKRGRWKEIKV